MKILLLLLLLSSFIFISCQKKREEIPKLKTPKSKMSAPRKEAGFHIDPKMMEEMKEKLAPSQEKFIQYKQKLLSNIMNDPILSDEKKKRQIENIKKNYHYKNYVKALSHFTKFLGNSPEERKEEMERVQRRLKGKFKKLNSKQRALMESRIKKNMKDKGLPKGFEALLPQNEK